MLVKLEVEKCLVIGFDFIIKVHLNGELVVPRCVTKQETHFERTIGKLHLTAGKVHVIHFHLESWDPILVDIRNLQRDFEEQQRRVESTLSDLTNFNFW